MLICVRMNHFYNDAIGTEHDVAIGTEHDVAIGTEHDVAIGTEHDVTVSKSRCKEYVRQH